MSDADADHRTHRGQASGELPPEWYAQPELAPALVGHDIGALYRWLNTAGGMAQRQIAARTGQSQSEVADILAGRRSRVTAYGC